VLVLLAIVAIPGLGARAQARTDDQRPIWDRYNTNVAALRIVEERPLFGVGWGRYPEVNGQYMRQSDAYPLTGVGLEVHNVPLGNVAELGLVGGALWLAALTAAVGGAVRRRPGTRLDPLQLGLVAVATNWLVVAMFVPLGYPLPNMLLWTWAGVATVLAAPRRAPSPARLPRPGMSTSVAS
jgi:O-antigen ligase